MFRSRITAQLGLVEVGSRLAAQGSVIRESIRLLYNAVGGLQEKTGETVVVNLQSKGHREGKAEMLSEFLSNLFRWGSYSTAMTEVKLHAASSITNAVETGSQ